MYLYSIVKNIVKMISSKHYKFCNMTSICIYLLLLSKGQCSLTGQFSIYKPIAYNVLHSKRGLWKRKCIETKYMLKARSDLLWKKTQL